MADESFYKNAFLLMQVVPASYECRNCFKKGMFNKPNTSGFIHMSDYLLSIHNAKRFRRMVKWPILNKMDEKRYRIEIKEYLGILAHENPDAHFPPVLNSHLIQAGGTRISVLMWKISQISLRAFIARNFLLINCVGEIDLLQIPGTGNNKDLTKTYFTAINKKRDAAIFKFYHKTKAVLESFEHYMQCKYTDLTKIQIEIFEVTKNIQKLVPTLPVHSSIAKRLADIDDVDIINSWKISIDHNIKFLRQKNSKLETVTNLGSKLHDLITELCANSKSFDGRDLPKLSIENLPLSLTNDIQHISSGLYVKQCLVFQALLSILDQTFKRVKYRLEVRELPDLSIWQPVISKHCKSVKSAEEIFQKILVQVCDDVCDAQYSLQEKSITNTSDTEFLYSMSIEALLTSPKFNFSTAECVDDEKILRKMFVSPERGKYKHLFKRYRNCNSFDSPRRLIASCQFNDSIESIVSDWKSPQKQTLIYKKKSPSNMNVSPRYSRLFTSDLRRNNLKVKNAASTPYPSQRKSNARTLGTQMVPIDAAMKTIFDLSCQITDAVASLSET